MNKIGNIAFCGTKEGKQAKPSATTIKNNLIIQQALDEAHYKNCKNIEELRDKIDKYVYYYNNGRYQWNLKRMAPKEYRHFLEKSYGSIPL